MRKVWGEALKQDDYDFFLLLLNDDVKVGEKDSIIKLINAYHKSDPCQYYFRSCYGLLNKKR